MFKPVFEPQYTCLSIPNYSADLVDNHALQARHVALLRCDFEETIDELFKVRN
jgi:hypothetical protein